MDTGKKVFIFIDNSNVFIQGKHAVANIENVGSWDKQRRQFNNLRIDYGSLVRTLQGERQPGCALLVGSRPPPNDTLWDKIKAQGLDVKVFDRNAANKEKSVDTTIAVEIMKTLYNNSTAGIIALVAGDGDYNALVDAINDKDWKLEVYFWQEGLSASLGQYSTTLDNMYKSFTFAIGREGTKGRRMVVVTPPSDDVATLKNEAVMQIVQQMVPPLFGWWNWSQEKALELFVQGKVEEEQLINWFKQHHPRWAVGGWLLA